MGRSELYIRCSFPFPFPFSSRLDMLSSGGRRGSMDGWAGVSSMAVVRGLRGAARPAVPEEAAGREAIRVRVPGGRADEDSVSLPPPLAPARRGAGSL